MIRPITIDAGAGIEQTENVDVITSQNEDVSAVISRLEGNGANTSWLIDRIKQI